MRSAIHAEYFSTVRLEVINQYIHERESQFYIRIDWL